MAGRKRKLETSTLQEHTFLTVRGSDPRLNLSTASLECTSSIQLNDFHSKKAAILSGLGFGWLPCHLIEGELQSGLLQPLPWKKLHRHIFRPYLYHRGGARLGRAGRIFVQELTGHTVSA